MTSFQRGMLRIFLCALVFVLGFGGYYLRKAWRYYQRDTARFEGDSFIRYDPVIGFVQAPNITTRQVKPPQFTIYSDDRGLRVQHPGLKTPPKVDLLAVGCSFTWGQGVEDSQTFIKIVAAKENLVAANAAVSSYGTTAAYLSMLRFADLKPSVIVYGFIEDHIARSMHPCAPTTSPFPRSVAFVDFDSKGAPFLQSPRYRYDKDCSFMKEIFLRHSFGWKDMYWAVQRDILQMRGGHWLSINARYTAAGNPELRKKAMHYLVDEMQKAVSGIGAQLIIVYMPSENAGPHVSVELKEAMEPYQRRGDIFFLDTTPLLEAYAKKNGWDTLMVDQHPNATAHRIIAEALAPLVHRLVGARVGGLVNGGDVRKL